MSPYQGSEDETRKLCSSTNELTWITSSYNWGKSNINSKKTSNFLDFAKAKSRSHSCKMTIHLLNFPPVICLVRTYWNGLKSTRRGWQRMRWLDGITESMDVWVNSGSWWWTGRPGVLRFMGSQRVGHNWATELNWTDADSCSVNTTATLSIGYSMRVVLKQV